MLTATGTGHGLLGAARGRFAFVHVMGYTERGCVYLYGIASCLTNFRKIETTECVMY